MHAAVVCSFDAPPHYGTYPEPSPTGPHDAVVEVLAAGLHPRVRSQADGNHYTSTGDLPLVPGIDGVGRLDDGTHVYFALPDTPLGSMAERTLIDRRLSLPLPDGVDAGLVAAGMNPGMSSWVALRHRVPFEPGQSVLVLGATGSAGQLAVQIAKHLGAGQVIGAGRDSTRLARLPSLGADVTVSLAGTPDEVAERLAVAADVDVVIDYLWGSPAAQAIGALLTRRRDRSARLSWVQIGAVAGATIELPSAALRSANLQVLGSGQGSVGTETLRAALPDLARTLAGGALSLTVRTLPLSAVQDAWTTPNDPGHRIVLTP